MYSLDSKDIKCIVCHAMQYIFLNPRIAPLARNCYTELYAHLKIKSWFTNLFAKKKRPYIYMGVYMYWIFQTKKITQHPIGHGWLSFLLRFFKLQKIKKKYFSHEENFKFFNKAFIKKNFVYNTQWVWESSQRKVEKEKIGY